MTNSKREPAKLSPQSAAGQAERAEGLVVAALQQLERSRVEYCLLRGGRELRASAEGFGRGEDIDLLVPGGQLLRMQAALRPLGFARIRSLGHWPHHFFVAYDEGRDVWIKLDVVTELAFGRPHRALRVPLVDACLATRERSGGVFVASPDVELLMLLLHCLLDKGRFEPKHRRWLMRLRNMPLDQGRVTRLFSQVVGQGLSWPEVAAAIDAQDWDVLLAQAPAVVRELTRRDYIGTVRRAIWTRVLRRLDPLVRPVLRRGMAIALLAPDGGGKTTLAKGLMKSFFLPARYIYAGSNVENQNVNLPTTRWLAKRKKRTPPRAAHRGPSAPLASPPGRAGQAGQAAGQQRSPAGMLWHGLGFINGLFDRWYRSAVGLYHVLRGRLVIFDRYVYDMLLQPNKGPWPKQLRNWLIYRFSLPADLVILLDAPGEILYQRSGEHSISFLEAQRQRYLTLQDRISNLIFVDATQDADTVRRMVTWTMWNTYSKRISRFELWRLKKASGKRPSRPPADLEMELQAAKSRSASHPSVTGSQD